MRTRESAQTINLPWTVRILAAVQLCHLTDVMFFAAVVPYLQDEWGTTAASIGWLITAYGIAAAGGALFGAAISDHYPRRHLLVLNMMLVFTSTIVCATTTTLPGLMLGRILCGMAAGMLPGLVHATIADLIPMDNRARAVSVIQTAFPVAAVVGFPALLFVADYLGWRFAFIALGGFSALTALVLIMLPWGLPFHGEPCTRPLSERMRLVFATRQNVMTLVFLAVAALPAMLIVPFLAPYLVHNVGVTKSSLPLIYFSGGVALLFAARSIGRMSDRFGHERVFRIFAVASILPILIITNLGTASTTAVVSLSVLYFLIVPARMIPAMAIITGRAPAEARGAFMSFGTFVQQSMGAVGAAVGASIIATADSGQMTGFEAVGLIAAMASLFAAGMVRTLLSQDRSSPTLRKCTK